MTMQPEMKSIQIVDIFGCNDNNECSVNRVYTLLSYTVYNKFTVRCYSSS